MLFNSDANSSPGMLVDTSSGSAIQISAMAERIPVPPAFLEENSLDPEKSGPALDIPRVVRRYALEDPPRPSSNPVQRVVEEVVGKVRVRVRYLADERPLQLVLTVAGISFLIGIGLRLWRNRYE